jgi:hypothetical protein
VVAPGRLEARYERLAGTEAQRTTLYVVRRRLNFTIDEWRALPWWQRRVYIEGLQDEADQLKGGGSSEPGGMSDPAQAILTGTLGDVNAALGK